MKRIVSIMLILVMALSVFTAVPVAAEENLAYKYISLSGNTTMYKNTTRAASELIVYAFDANGNQTEITGSSYLTYSSNNPIVFDFVSGTNKLESKSEYGMATVTATYTNPDGNKISASVIFQRAAAGSVTPDLTKWKYDAFPGHVKGSANSFSWSAETSAGQQSYAFRAYKGGNSNGLDWNTSNLRSVTGWFYDDGTKDNYAKYQVWFIWHGGKRQEYAFNYNQAIGINAKTDDYYSPYNKAKVPRTKGWHQVTCVVDKMGYISHYIDGICVRTEKVPLGNTTAANAEKGTSYIEMRCTDTGAGNRGIYDDMVIADYTGIKPEYNVEVEATGCLVNKDGSTLAYPAKNNSVVVKKGESITLNIAPLDGYINPKVTLYGITDFNTKEVSVTGNTCVFTPEHDSYLQVSCEVDPDAVEINKTVFFEDFLPDAEDSTKTQWGSELATGGSNAAAVVLDWDKTAGKVKFIGGSANERFSYKKNGGLFTIKAGRTYKHIYNITASKTGSIYFEGSIGRVLLGKNAYFAIPGSTGVDTNTKQITASYVPVFKDGKDSTTFNTFSLMCMTPECEITFDSIKVEEIYYGYPVNVVKSGNGKVLFGDKEISGSTAFDVGNAELSITPDEGYEIKSVTYGGSPVVVSDKNGCEIAINVASKEDLNVEFASKEAVLPSVTVGDAAVEKNYSAEIDGQTVTSANSIIMYASIAAGYGKTVTGSGYKLVKVGVNDDNPLVLPAVATVFAGEYGIRAIGPKLEEGEYKVTPYIIVEGVGEIAGETKTVEIK